MILLETKKFLKSSETDFFARKIIKKSFTVMKLLEVNLWMLSAKAEECRKNNLGVAILDFQQS